MKSASITVIGNAGNVRDLKFGKNGKAYFKFGLANTESVREGDQWIDGETTWYEITCFGALAEAASDNISKGKQVIVLGTLKRSEWKDQDGTPKVSFEVLAENLGIVPFRNRNSGGRSDGRRAVRQDQMDAPF